MRNKSLLVLPLILLSLLTPAAVFAGGQKESKEQQPVELAFSF